MTYINLLWGRIDYYFWGRIYLGAEIPVTDLLVTLHSIRLGTPRHVGNSYSFEEVTVKRGIF